MQLTDLRIPTAILRLKNLNSDEKLVLTLIYQFSKKYGYCSASVFYISESLGMTIRAVERHLEFLEARTNKGKRKLPEPLINRDGYGKKKTFIVNTHHIPDLEPIIIQIDEELEVTTNMTESSDKSDATFLPYNIINQNSKGELSNFKKMKNKPDLPIYLQIAKQIASVIRPDMSEKELISEAKKCYVSPYSKFNWYKSLYNWIDKYDREIEEYKRQKKLDTKQTIREENSDRRSALAYANTQKALREMRMNSRRAMQ